MKAYLYFFLILVSCHCLAATNILYRGGSIYVTECHSPRWDMQNDKKVKRFGFTTGLSSMMCGHVGTAQVDVSGFSEELYDQISGIEEEFLYVVFYSDRDILLDGFWKYSWMPDSVADLLYPEVSELGDDESFQIAVISKDSSWKYVDEELKKVEMGSLGFDLPPGYFEGQDERTRRLRKSV